MDKLQRFVVWWETCFDEEYDTCGEMDVEAHNAEEAKRIAKIPYHSVITAVFNKEGVRVK